MNFFSFSKSGFPLLDPQRTLVLGEETPGVPPTHPHRREVLPVPALRQELRQGSLANPYYVTDPQILTDSDPQILTYLDPQILTESVPQILTDSDLQILTDSDSHFLNDSDSDLIDF